MQATANASCRNTRAQLLAPHILQKRRGFNGGARSTAESASGKSVPLVSVTDYNNSNYNNLTEAQIIERAQSGDEAMFELLYRRHSQRVYAVCLRMLKDPAEAEDLTQEAFLLLFRKIHTFRGESAFSTWLHRLAVNRVLMCLRRKSLPAVSLDEPLDANEPNGPPAIDLGCRDSILEGSLDRINLERCIRRLPTGYRTILVLHDVQGYKHQEIAKIMGRSVGDSKSQLHKARAQLRVLLHELQRAKARDRRLAAKVHPARCAGTVAMAVRCARNACCTRLSERPFRVTAPIARIARSSANGTN
jgi:RNA polymerase sigma-70 factor (ECF subfamily)